MNPRAQIERHLAWDGCLNIRDVGGYLTDAGTQTRWRALVRADNLCTLTPGGCAALEAYGVRTIIDLRQAFELAKAPHPMGPMRRRSNRPKRSSIRWFAPCLASPLVWAAVPAG